MGRGDRGEPSGRWVENTCSTAWGSSGTGVASAAGSAASRASPESDVSSPPSGTVPVSAARSTPAEDAPVSELPPPSGAASWTTAVGTASTMAVTASGAGFGFRMSTTAAMISTAMPAMMAMAMRF